jgi:hypothetical protein
MAKLLWWDGMKRNLEATSGRKPSLDDYDRLPDKNLRFPRKRLRKITKQVDR